MKNYLLYVFPLLLFAFIGSCDDSFLEENKKQLDGYNIDVPLLVEPVSEFTEVSITLPDLKNKDFKVLQYPKIIHFESFKGHIDEIGKLTFKIKVDEFDNPIHLEPVDRGNIVLDVEGFGLLAVKVQSVNWGTPKASISETFFDFDVKRQEKDFKIENWADGFLWYQMVKKPSWVNIRRTSLSENYLEINDVRMIQPSSYEYYSIFPNTDGLAPGEYEDEIIFETTDEANPVLKINVKIRVLSYENPESMIPIDGTIIDAEFDKNTNTLLLITQNPSLLISYNIDTEVKNQVALDGSPYCINLSVDKKMALLGESGQMEFIEIPSLNVKEKIAVDYVVSDIVDGENGYYYLTNKERELFSFHTESKIISKLTVLENNAGTVEADMILKVKNKPQLLLSRLRFSPNGLYLIDISKPTNPQFINYWHDGFGDKIFTSTNQDKVYSKHNGHVYRFPNETATNQIYDLGKLIPFEGNSYEYYFYYTWFDHNPTTSKIWGTYDSQLWLDKNIVSEFDDQTFDRLRTIPLNDYAATINGVKDYYKTIAHFVFSSKNGERLLLVKNIDEYETNNWHLEIIDVTN